MSYHDISDIMDDGHASTSMRKIFGVHFPVFIKQVYLYDDFDLDVAGIPTTLDKNYDSDLSNTSVRAAFVIADLAEFFDEGVEFTFENKDHPRKIYDYIKTYVELAGDAFNDRQIKKEMMISDNGLQRFIKDIQKLENFGNALVPLFTKMSVSTEYKKITSGFGRARMNLNKAFSRTLKLMSEEDKREFKSFRIDIRKSLLPSVLSEAQLFLRRD